MLCFHVPHHPALLSNHFFRYQFPCINVSSSMPTQCENGSVPNCSRSTCVSKKIECCQKKLTVSVMQQVSASSSGAIVTSLFSKSLVFFLPIHRSLFSDPSGRR